MSSTAAHPSSCFTVPDAQLMRKHLDGKGIAVRRCDTFVGLDGEFLRAAVRPDWPVLVEAIAEVAAMSVPVADIIDVLDAAYPPRLAQDWDSVGLVCGDPAETVETVTVAVDATAAVVAEVPDRGLLLAHHPLLLRGVDTVAASTAKGALRAPDDPHRTCVVHGPHERRRGVARGVRRARRRAGADRRRSACADLGGRRHGQVGGLRARRKRRRGAGGDVRRGRGSHR